jgi:ribosomal protein S18 acetylase RimI-like enzyme
MTTTLKAHGDRTISAIALRLPFAMCYSYRGDTIMPVTYRAMRADEALAVVDLWATTLNHDRAMIDRRWRDDPLYLEHTVGAVAHTGEILAAISYFLRTVRDASGTPQRIGHLFYVATRPDAQQQGHGRELLARTTRAMQEEGCQWGMVSAGAPARGFYDRAGWKLYDTPYRQGAVSTDRLDTPTPYHIHAYDPMQAPQGWAPLIPIYAAYNAQRPLTTVRDQAYWDGWVALMFQFWKHPPHVFVATRENANMPCGYVFAHYYPVGFVISEIGVAPTESDAILVLLNAVADEALRRGSPARGRVYLPTEPAVDLALVQLFGTTLHAGAEPDSMLHPIEARMTTRQVDMIVMAPGAIRWGIDQV